MDWLLLTPEIIVTVTALVVLVLDFSLRASFKRQALGVVALAGTALALVATAFLSGARGEMFQGVFLVDATALFFKVIFLTGALLVLLLSFSYLQRHPGQRGEFYWLNLTALLGMMVTVSSGELITIYVGIELISLSFYALVGFHRKQRQATEAALKYFVLGSFAIAVWLYGAALVYGLTGRTDLAGIAASLDGGGGPVLLIAVLLLVAGFGFKMGLAPFHLWVPDAYQGAPTPVTAFLATGSKAAAFGVFLRVMQTAFGSLYEDWVVVLGLLAVLTMTWGNVAALRQTNVKRMLAYSGIAQAGYVLVGVLAAGQVGSQAVMFYLFGYLFATMGAFAVVIAFANSTGSEIIADFAGLRWRNSWLALALTLCLLSLAGIPPLAGFLGKFYLFWGAARHGGWLVAVVVIAAINSAVSLFYYVNVIRVMYFVEPAKGQGTVASSPLVNLTLAVALAGVLLAVFYFQPVVGALAAGLAGGF